MRQLDHKLANALAEGSLLGGKHTSNMTSSLMNTGNRHSGARQFGTSNSNSLHQNLNQLSSIGDNYMMETRAFPYERLAQTNAGGLDASSAHIHSSHLNNNHAHNYRTNSSCKIYQDLDEFKGHLV